MQPSPHFLFTFSLSLSLSLCLSLLASDTAQTSSPAMDKSISRARQDLFGLVAVGMLAATAQVGLQNFNILLPRCCDSNALFPALTLDALPHFRP